MNPDADIQIRAATPDDVPLLHAMIRELAEYERLLHACVAGVDDLAAALFGPTPRAEAIVASLDGHGVGFALYFHSFSTFVGRAGLYLEDLFVRPTARGHGVGRALLVRLAQIAVDRGCGRFEWSVLDWNEPAIGFYRSIGAVPMDEWTVFRLDGDRLLELAQRAPSPADS